MENCQTCQSYLCSCMEHLTSEECGVLYRNLAGHWLNRSDDYELARTVVNRLYRKWQDGLKIKDEI